MYWGVAYSVRPAVKTDEMPFEHASRSDNKIVCTNYKSFGERLQSEFHLYPYMIVTKIQALQKCFDSQKKMLPYHISRW